MFTYPKFMDRDFQKVLEALNTFDLKLVKIEKAVDGLVNGTYEFAKNQQDLNQNNAEALKSIVQGLDNLFDGFRNLSDVQIQINEKLIEDLQNKEEN